MLGVVKDLVFVVVVCLLASGLRRWWLIAAAMVVPMAVICLLGGLNEWFLGNTATFGGFETVTTAEGVGVVTKRHAGPVPDANFWGRFLVLGLPFALALGHDAVRHGRRLLALVPLGCIGLMLVGIYLTGSRGTMIGALVGVGAYLLLSGLDRRALLGAAAVGLPLVLVLPGVGSRLLSVLGASDDGQVAAGDASMRERIATQTVATKMIEAHPVTGVGPGGYFARFPDYAAATDLRLERIVAPHNVYLGTWAEIGLVGLLAFLSVIAVALWHAATVLRTAPADLAPGSPGAQLRPYAAAVVGALLAWCAASVFLHLTYARTLYLVVALAAAMATQAHALGWGALPRAGRRRRPRPWRLIVPAAAVGAVAVALVVWALPRPAQAYAVGYLVPQDSSSYLLSLRTREVTAPTYAVVASAAGGHQVDAQGDPSSGLITLAASGATPQQAAATARESMRLGDEAVHRAGLDVLFRTRWEPVASWAPGPDRTTLAVGAAAGAAAGAALALLVDLRRRSRRPGGSRTPATPKETP
ncbi:hypothetical protein ADJ73_00080 [Arsenicicoccus sp. oral taxon 190]|nr:hypothetical protein ADJ73_00080 [Arsenicicoccus sp. oral taxon 190]